MDSPASFEGEFSGDGNTIISRWDQSLGVAQNKTTQTRIYATITRVKSE
jgi:hypothetical protein